MAISRDQVDEIKSRVSIIDVAAERVNLSRHGSTMSVSYTHLTLPTTSRV